MLNSNKKKYDYDYILPFSEGGLVSLEDINKITPMFNDKNPLTYTIYLEANRSKLSEKEITAYEQLIQFLLKQEKDALDKVMQCLKDRREYEN